MTDKWLLPPALAGLLTLFGPALSPAQELLTVEQAVAEALAKNASLRAADAEVAEGDARLGEVRSGWFPRISIAETWQRGNAPVFVFSSLLAARQFGSDNFALDVLNRPDPLGFFRTSIVLDQMLFDGGRQRAAVDDARAHRDIGRFSRDETRARLIVSTTEAYGRVLAADSGLLAVEAALKAAQQDRANASHRREAGLATDADVLAFDARVAELDHQRIQYRGDTAIARAELNRLMGAPIARPHRLHDTTLALAAANDDIDVATLLAEADANRPEIQRAAAAVHRAHTSRRSATAALMPSVGAQLAFEVSGTDVSHRASAWIVGVEARWSLSLGGAERARLRAAAAAERRAEAEADDTRAAVHVDVVTAIRRWQSAVARVSAGRTAVAQAREAERIVRDRVEAGLATVTDLLRASTAVLDAEARRTAAAVDALIGDAHLTRALGRHP